MDIRNLTAKLPTWAYKYRYAILVLAIGLMLMLLPGKKQTQQTQAPETAQQEQTTDMTQELSHILSKIKGVGKVEVLLTVKAGQKTVYHADEDVSGSENSSTVRVETVIITDSDRNQQPLVSQILPPEYLGAVVVCQGADDVQVRLAVVEAVSKATGLGTDKITVLKMK